MEADDLEGRCKDLATGYGQSKWASELLVREAGLRGLANAVIRPSYITADPTSGFLLQMTSSSDYGRNHCR